MFRFIPIYKREVRAYFQSPATYVVLSLFFLIIGLFFQDLMALFSIQSKNAQQMMTYGNLSAGPNLTDFVIRGIFQLISSLILFTIPLLSMHLLAEEKNRGTFELLATCPLSDWSIILGKYFALLTVGLSIIVFSAIYPVITWWVGASARATIEWPIVLSCWIGLFLIFSTYAAFGLMASAFTENQISAAMITLIGLLLWNISGDFQMDGFPTLRRVVSELSAAQHMQNFINGVLMLKEFAFYMLTAFLFLFIASKTLDARRWRV